MSYVDIKFYENKEYSKLDFSEKKIQIYYVLYSINNNIDNPTIIKNFNTLSNYI